MGKTFGLMDMSIGSSGLILTGFARAARQDLDAARAVGAGRLVVL